MMNTIFTTVFSDGPGGGNPAPVFVEADSMTEEELSTDTLNSIDIMDENPLPLLYQSGYLTISSYDARFDCYTLCFPNREVERGFIHLVSMLK